MKGSERARERPERGVFQGPGIQCFLTDSNVSFNATMMPHY